MSNKIEMVANYDDIVRTHNKKIRFFSEYGLDINKYPISDYFYHLLFQYVQCNVLVYIFGLLYIIASPQKWDSFISQIFVSFLFFILNSVHFYIAVTVRDTWLKKTYFKNIKKACIRWLERDKRNIENNKEKLRIYDFIFSDKSIKVIAE